MRNAALVATLVLLSGCLDYDEVISLAADGSGSVQVNATVDLSFAEKLMALSVLPGEKALDDMDDPYKMMVSEVEIRKNVQGGEGITLKQCLVEELDKSETKKKIKLSFDFKTLDALRKTTGFASRELSFVEKDGDIEVTYKVDARFLKDLGLIFDGARKDETELEKKMRKVVEDATADAGARFTVHLPAKPSATNGKRVDADPNAVRIELAKKDAKAHAALAKEPLVLTATFPGKDASALLKKPEPKSDKPVPPPVKKDGD
ncbi:MAG: hypothetical protein ACAI25_04595 [Planctomycetota bacterium]